MVLKTAVVITMVRDNSRRFAARGHKRGAAGKTPDICGPFAASCQVNVDAAMMGNTPWIRDNVILDIPTETSSALRMAGDRRLSSQFGPDPGSRIANIRSPHFPM